MVPQKPGMMPICAGYFTSSIKRPNGSESNRAGSLSALRQGPHVLQAVVTGRDHSARNPALYRADDHGSDQLQRSGGKLGRHGTLVRKTALLTNAIALALSGNKVTPEIQETRPAPCLSAKWRTWPLPRIAILAACRLYTDQQSTNKMTQTAARKLQSWVGFNPLDKWPMLRSTGLPLSKSL